MIVASFMNFTPWIDSGSRDAAFADPDNTEQFARHVARMTDSHQPD